MPATMTGPAPAAAVKQRTLALAAYLGPLREGMTGKSLPIVVKLQQDAWIRTQIERHAEVGLAEPGAVCVLVAHASALLAKCHSDLHSVESAGAADKSALYTYQAELMLDVAIGTALLRELQPRIDENVQAGKMAPARGLSELGHRIRKAINAAKQVISDAGHSDADRLADTMASVVTVDANGSKDETLAGVVRAVEGSR